MHRIEPARRAAALAIAACTLAYAARADAHGIVGNRFFPATIATDDPFVSDELSAPTVSTMRQDDPAGSPPIRDTFFGVELEKRITPDLGISIGDAYHILSQKGSQTLYGWENLEVGAKYVFFKSPEHELIFSTGLAVEIGGTGARQIGADPFSTFTPSFFFGKGFGDLPDTMGFLRPFAITGAFGLAIPTRAKTVTTSTDPDTGDILQDIERHPNVLNWGFAVEYSLPYLQSFVKDVGLGPPFDRMIPLIEFNFQTPMDRGGGPTTGTINPGVIWSGQYFQLGVEAMIPINSDSGHDVGVIAQLHFYLDDIFPNSIGKPLFP